jgi:hypothetical protein
MARSIARITAFAALASLLVATATAAAPAAPAEQPVGCSLDCVLHIAECVYIAVR